jgi:3-oxoacyl-[acyl-carrier protein] reductase
VAVNYSRSREEAESAAAEAEKLGVKAIAVQADVADDAAVRQMAAAVEKAFGRLDVLVNNAGMTKFVPHDQLEGLLPEDWSRIFAVNVQGAFYCAFNRWGVRSLTARRRRRCSA